ncbi:hypothetical protein SRHO_G00092450 [Serrasalmus rhombeus]
MSGEACIVSSACDKSHLQHLAAGGQPYHADSLHGQLVLLTTRLHVLLVLEAEETTSSAFSTCTKEAFLSAVTWEELRPSIRNSSRALPAVTIETLASVLVHVLFFKMSSEEAVPPESQSVSNSVS